MNTLVLDYREDEELRPMLAYSEDFVPGTDRETEADLCVALPGYPEFAEAGDPAEFTGEMRAKAVALLRVASAMAVYGDPPLLERNRIADPELYRLIIEDPSRAEALAQLVEERQTLSGALAREWLAAAGPLRDGSL